MNKFIKKYKIRKIQKYENTKNIMNVIYLLVHNLNSCKSRG